MGLVRLEDPYEGRASSLHLRFIFVWHQDRLVLVWPGMITRHNRFWKAEVPVATNADYVDFMAPQSKPRDRSDGPLDWSIPCAAKK
jgi:hypothetical protein